MKIYTNDGIEEINNSTVNAQIFEGMLNVLRNNAIQHKAELKKALYKIGDSRRADYRATYNELEYTDGRIRGFTEALNMVKMAMSCDVA